VGIDNTPFKLILNGGLFRHRGDVLVDAILNRVRQNASGVAAVRSAYEPVIGALLLAFEEAGIGVTPDLTERLDSTLPHDSLFET
jgi:hypothetical protein